MNNLLDNPKVSEMTLFDMLLMHMHVDNEVEFPDYSKETFKSVGLVMPKDLKGYDWSGYRNRMEAKIKCAKVTELIKERNRRLQYGLDNHQTLLNL